MRIKAVVLAFCIMASASAVCQDTSKLPKKDSSDMDDISKLLDEQLKSEEKTKTDYVTATFKTTRLVNGHSVENTGRGVMDMKIGHRFGTMNLGLYELFGLDNATMRMGLDFGVTDNLMVGFGRSTFEKTLDAFFKIRLLRQSTGKVKMPITLSYVPTIALKTQKWEDPNQVNYFSSRLFYTHQLIIGRKMSEGLSLQLMPSYVHRNLVAKASDPNDIIAMGIGGRQKLNKRTSLNVEYYYQVPGHRLPGKSDALSIGFDIETGGHVFQLHFTNSRGMNERTFISETENGWDKGEILFGFNISRVFNITNKKR